MTEIADGRFALLPNALGTDLFTAVRRCKVLVVGAGGIGSELLKNLVLSGFRDIEVLDLDTIDLSNLNRQFLFQKQHIGKPKALIARESVLNFCPSANIVAHHADVKDAKFGPDFIARFDIVMNALDNIGARRHVNRLCLAAGRPLIESGTAGYLGQVSVHLKGKTECYECQPKPTPKTYATCTIRSSPSAPIHCIVWAKYLFARLFGEPDDQNSVTELEADEAGVSRGQLPDPQIAAEEAELAREEKEHGFAAWVFRKVFRLDIMRLLKMRAEGKEGRAPIPLPPRAALVSSHSQYDQDANAADGGRLPEQMVWSLPQCVMKFFEAMEQLQARRKEGPLSFSKDDEGALTFVTAASNLRSHIFGIPLQSRFDVKASAGNIIAAIATTNAIIAGLIVLQALKMLASNPMDARCVYLNRKPSRNRLLVSSNLDIPNENCFVCGANYVTLSLDTKRWTLGTLIDKVLRQQLGFHEPNVDTGVTYIEGGNEGLEPAEIAARDKQLLRPLHEVGIASGKMLTVSDQSQNLTVTIAVRQKDDAPGADPAFEVTGKAKAAKEDPATAAAAAVAPPPGPNDARAPLVIEDDDLVLTVLPRTPTAGATTAKRSVAEVPEEAAEDGDSQAAKKMKR